MIFSILTPNDLQLISVGCLTENYIFFTEVSTFLEYINELIIPNIW